MRWTKTSDPMVRAAPEGVIDPVLKTIGFWNEDEPLAVAHYYATHPTSLDGTGVVNPEFVGLARNRRTAKSGVPHLYFTGCAGNVAAGKYNDGLADNRELFAGRIHDAMTAAEQAAERQPLAELRWVVEPVTAAAASGPGRRRAAGRAYACRAQSRARISAGAALMLTYLRRHERPIPVTCLHFGAEAAILHLPGETFIEYQLHAQAARPGAFRGRRRLRRPGIGLHHPGAVVRRGRLRTDGRLRLRRRGGNSARRDR